MLRARLATKTTISSLTNELYGLLYFIKSEGHFGAIFPFKLESMQKYCFVLLLRGLKIQIFVIRKNIMIITFLLL